MTIDFLSKTHDSPFFLVTSYLNPHDCCELARNISGLGDEYHDGPVEEKMDEHILNVVNTLEKQGLLENTIIFYTSDHGDGHASHQWNQKMTFYEESINVPFVISWKGKTKAGLIDSKTLTSSGLDLYPTIC